MWADNPWDEVNVNERVIVPAEDIEANGGGKWEVRVRSRTFATDSQKYSLVVTGAISPAESSGGLETATAGMLDDDEMAEAQAESAAPPTVAVAGGAPFLPAAASALAALLSWA